MFHNENLAGKRCSSPSSCCLQGIRFPCTESLPSLVQPPLSRLRGPAEPFRGLPRQASASGAATPPLPTLPSHLQHLRTWKSNFLRHPHRIPRLGRSGSFPANPPRLAFGAQNHIFFKIKFLNSWWKSRGPICTTKNTLLADCACGCTDPPLSASSAFLHDAATPCEGGTPIHVRALRHYMSQRPETFWSRPIASCIACDLLQLSSPSSAPVSQWQWMLLVLNSAPVVASGCKRWGQQRKTLLQCWSR